MGTVQYLHDMNIEPPISRILLRMGYQKNTTVIDDEQMSDVYQNITWGAALCQPRGAFLRLPIIQRTQNQVEIQGHIFYSQSLASLLLHSEEVIIFAVTVGNDIIGAIEDEIHSGGGAKAIVLDSTASQIADATAAWVMEFVQKQLRREGKTTTKTRYSPGYGDLSLAHQSIFFELLHLEQLGMKLTESFMMMPEKSVTAICGVETIGV